MDTFALRLFAQQIAKSNVKLLKYMLDNNISLRRMFPEDFPPVGVVKLGLIFHPVKFEEINTQNIMRLVKEYNPTVYKMIMEHNNGLRWIDSNLREVIKIYSS